MSPDDAAGPGRPGPETALEAVHRAFGRLTDMQGEVVGILDDLLGAPIDAADAAIVAALGRLGGLTGADRVTVQPLGDPDGGARAGHVWASPRAPARGALALLPEAVLARWRAELGAGRAVIVADAAMIPPGLPASGRSELLAGGIRSALAVPMVSDGALQGFLALESAVPYAPLPGETHLVRSMARVVGSVLARRDAEARLVAARDAAARGRTRLVSVLAAMPDLVVELDREGRFVDWHSGAFPVPDAVVAALEGRRVEEALPPDLAARARQVMAEVDRGEVPEPFSFPFPLVPGEDRWWQLSASSAGDLGYLFVLRDVTRARAQTAEIERLSEIARRTSNLVIVTDAERRIEWVNDAFERVTGWPLAEARGRVPTELLLHPDADRGAVREVRAELAVARGSRATTLCRARDGRPLWLDTDIMPLRDPAGTVTGYMGVQIDVTEQRARDEALRDAARAAAQSRATLEAAIGALEDGFVFYDADDRLVVCNARYREVYPLSAPSIVPGARFEDILRYGLARGEYAEAVGREEAWLEERLALHRQADSRVEQHLSDGRWLRIYEKATPDGGRVGLRIDVTALKLAEQRAQSDRATAMAASQDGIAINDADGVFLYMNPAHLRLFGYDDEKEIVGRPWTVLYGEAEAQWMREHALPRLHAEGRWRGEILGRARDGSPVDQEVSLTLKDDGGILCIARDLSEQRREAAERERLRESLQVAQRREMLGQVAAGLAHDFNNLLATIVGSASLIAESSPAGGAAAAGAARIEAAAEQGAALVGRLMALGSRPVDRREIDLRRPVREAADLVRAGLKAPTVLDLALPDAPLVALADPTDVLQVVLNLAINARDALGASGGRIGVALGAAAPGAAAGEMALGRLEPGRRYARLTVTDTGAGIPAEVAPRIFEPWVSSKGEAGNGLGLSIVASVVKASGGAVRVASRPGRGAAFEVFWPLGADVPPVPADPGPALVGRLDGRAILVVDDHAGVLDVVVEMLEAAGAEVAPTTEPADVVAAVRADPDAWDLVVTDYDMPGMTGARLAAELEAVAPRLPVILLTALAGVAGREHARFAAVLAKPVSRAQLVRAAETAIVRASPGE